MLVGLGNKGMNPKKKYEITVDNKNNVKSINNRVTVKMNLNSPTRPYITGDSQANQSVDNSD